MYLLIYDSFRPAALPVDKAPLWACSMLRCRLSSLDGIQQVKGRDSLEELVANHGKGVLVHLVVVQFMPEHLRRHVPEQTTKNKDICNINNAREQLALPWVAQQAQEKCQQLRSVNFLMSRG
jgi:hypothetical protein